MPAFIVGDGPRDSGPPPNLAAFEEFDDARSAVQENIRQAFFDIEAPEPTLLLAEVAIWDSTAPYDGHGHWFANIDLDGVPWHFWIIYDPTANAEDFNDW